MRKARNSVKAAALVSRVPAAGNAGGSREKVAEAIHHCLKYLSRDARRHGMAQTASILDMVAHLAMDEARAAR